MLRSGLWHFSFSCNNLDSSPQCSMFQARVWHCFRYHNVGDFGIIILQCRNLDCDVRNYGAEAYIAASLIATPNSRLRYQNFLRLDYGIAVYSAKV